MFPCLLSLLCSIALCGVMLLKLHQVCSCIVWFGSWNTDNTGIIGSDVFIICSEKLDIWCEFLEVSESILQDEDSFPMTGCCVQTVLWLPFTFPLSSAPLERNERVYWKLLVVCGERQKPVHGIQHPPIPWQRKKAMDVSWTSIHAVWGWHLALSSDTSVCTYWESREWHGLIQENSSSEQDSHEHWATGCVYMTSCDTCLTDLSALSVCGCSLSLLGVCLRAGGELIPLSGRRSSCGQQQQQMVCHVTQLTSGRAAFLRNAQVSLGGTCLAIQSQVMIPGWCLFGLIGLPWK